MKKTILLVSLAIFIFSCGNNNSNTNGSTNANGTNANGTSTSSAPAKTDPDVEKGLALVAKSDCFTCHKIADQSVGPAYQKVAQKYTASPEVIDSLSQKVIKGGSGNWGTVPMTPHQTLSKEDAQAMVKYVLSLKP